MRYLARRVGCRLVALVTLVVLATAACGGVEERVGETETDAADTTKAQNDTAQSDGTGTAPSPTASSSASASAGADDTSTPVAEDTGTRTDDPSSTPSDSASSTGQTDNADATNSTGSTGMADDGAAAATQPETPAAPTEARPEVLALGTDLLQGAFDPATVAGSDVLLWFWTPW